MLLNLVALCEERYVGKSKQHCSCGVKLRKYEKYKLVFSYGDENFYEPYAALKCPSCGWTSEWLREDVVSRDQYGNPIVFRFSKALQKSLRLSTQR